MQICEIELQWGISFLLFAVVGIKCALWSSYICWLSLQLCYIHNQTVDKEAKYVTEEATKIYKSQFTYLYECAL